MTIETGLGNQNADFRVGHQVHLTTEDENGAPGIADYRGQIAEVGSSLFGVGRWRSHPSRANGDRERQVAERSRLCVFPGGKRLLIAESE
jgi:hypothetical protein